MQDSPAQELQRNSYRDVIIESLKVVAIAAVTVFIVRYFLFKPFYVKGASMEPTFHENEYLIIDEITYRFRGPVRGEVVVFKYPDVQKDYFLKRVIGLPGERIKVSGGKILVYNAEHPEGIAVEEKYLPADLPTLGEQDVTLTDNQLFVLGDNRPNSFDSRRFGPVDRSQIVGRVVVRGWPINRVQAFEAPTFNF
jgi:signal peptidase I